MSCYHHNTELLVGEDLPVHNHGNGLIRKTVKETENAVIKRYENVHGASPAAVLQDISQNMLNSNFPDQLSSASSSSAIKMRLWRQRKTINPTPKIPRTHQEYMAIDAPERFTKTSDGGEFLVFKVFLNNA